MFLDQDQGNNNLNNGIFTGIILPVDWIMVTLEIRLFNKLQSYAKNGEYRFYLSVPQRVTYHDLLNLLKIPENDVFLALRNGRNIELFPRDDLLDNGEIIALSGPVPYSRGYGSPVV